MSSGSSLFSSRPCSTASELIYFVPPAREELCAIAYDCVRLRKKLSLPFEGTMPHTLLAACSGNTDAVGAQRRLADLLLAGSTAPQLHPNPLLARP